MPHYIEFPTDEPGVTVLVEADEEEVDPPVGIEKAGLGLRKNRKVDAVATASVRFDVAVKRIVEENVRALTDAVDKLKRPPDNLELTFGLKATGEVGNLAIAKVGGEATFQLKLSWKTVDQASVDMRVSRPDGGATT
jgi:Trypsin-co-occurring domain 1